MKINTEIIINVCLGMFLFNIISRIPRMILLRYFPEEYKQKKKTYQEKLEEASKKSF